MLFSPKVITYKANCIAFMSSFCVYGTCFCIWHVLGNYLANTVVCNSISYFVAAFIKVTVSMENLFFFQYFMHDWFRETNETTFYTWFML